MQDMAILVEIYSTTSIFAMLGEIFIQREFSATTYSIQYFFSPLG